MGSIPFVSVSEFPGELYPYMYEISIFYAIIDSNHYYSENGSDFLKSKQFVCIKKLKIYKLLQMI